MVNPERIEKRTDCQTHIHTHAGTYVHIQICRYVRICIYICLYICVRNSVFVYSPTWYDTYAYMVCIYIYIDRGKDNTVYM